MKRSYNSLFIAYLLFILICAIIKCIYKYDTGSNYEVFFQKLIIGVTISSFFFVLSDVMTSASELIQYERDQLNQVGKEIISLSNEMIIEIEKEDNPSENDLESLKELRDSVNEIKTRVINKPITKRYDILAMVFSTIGFLVFLLCLSFQSVTDYFIPQQDQCTLLAFFFVLSNPYINELTKKRVGRSINQYRETLEMIKSRRVKRGIKDTYKPLFK